MTRAKNLPSAIKDCRRCGKPFRCPGFQVVGPKERKYCSSVCMHAAKKFTPEQAAKAFWERVDKNGPNGCWVWNGYCQKFGHGWLGRLGLAHRYAWTLLRGPLKGRDCLLHHCDNPPCVNPDHLFIGDRQANAGDAKAKGRTTFGAKNWTAKLTEAQVIQILALKGTATQDVIASRYGVSQTAIAAIFKGKSWAYLHERRGPQLHAEGKP